MFGIVPSTPGASSAGPIGSRAAVHPVGRAPHSRASVAIRQRIPKRAACGSVPMPTYTPVRRRRQRTGLVERLVGHLEHRQLLAERRLQIVRREPLLGEAQLDVGHAALTVASRHGVAPSTRVGERLAADRRGRGDAEADDGDGGRRRLGASGADARERARVALTPAPRRSGGRCCRRSRTPRRRRAGRRRARRRGATVRPRVSRRNGRSGERVERVLDVQGRRAHLVAHRLDHLDQAGDARRGDQVAECWTSAIRSADRRSRRTPPHVDSQLGGVADLRAGGVAFEQRDVGRLDSPATSNAWRIARTWPAPDGTSMPAPRPSFDRPTPRMMPWIVSPSRDRVVEAPQRDEAASLGGHEAVGVAVERPRPAAAAQRLERGEAHVDEQVVGAVDGSGEHEVGDAVVQPIAGQLDRVQAARTGRVERERAGAQTRAPVRAAARGGPT